ncbi:conserved hypothetical protein, partial [Ricinus communis]
RGAGRGHGDAHGQQHGGNGPDDEARKAHAIHAQVMHEGHAQAQQGARAQHARPAFGPPRDKGQRHRGGGNGGAQGQQGFDHGVARTHAQVQRQHAREMHGPHADAAQRRACRQQVQPAEALASPDALRRSQGHKGAQYGNAIGQDHQAHAPGGLDDLIRLNGFIHVGSSSFAEKWDNTRVIAAVLPVGEAWQAIPSRMELPCFL